MDETNTWGANPNADDGFGPPDPPVEVRCMHCCAAYQSDQMVFEQRHGMPDKLWWCPTPNCRGAGFRFDIYPTSEPMGKLGGG